MIHNKKKTLWRSNDYFKQRDFYPNFIVGFHVYFKPYNIKQTYMVLYLVKKNDVMTTRLID